jgi:hypothetical protein
MRELGTWIALLISISCGSFGCGDSAGENSGGGPPANNVVPLVVNAGPGGAAAGYINAGFASATICLAGNDANCQTIDGLLVDTGSTGLRILSPLVQLSLTRVQDANGNDLANCVKFEDGTYFFGPVARADVKLGGELAKNVPIQMIAPPGSPDFPKPPADCTNGGGVNAGTLDGLGANGVLGLGLFQQDCGSVCETDASPGAYFGCTTSDCSPTTAPLDKQLSNPVSAFATDNNGVVIALPSVASGGTATASGTLTFGIGTQPDNALEATSVLWPDAAGNVTTEFQGQAYGESAIDSGSNAIYFLDAKTSGMPTCKTNTDFYCPLSTVSLSVSLVGDNGIAQPVAFGVANADSILAKDDYAFSELAGTNAPNVGFLFGIPFFYGRKVVTAIEGASTPLGGGPYWAY